MTAHGPNWPPLAEQDRTHGAGLPAEDRGLADEAKYGPGGI